MLTTTLPILNLDMPEWRDLNSFAIADISSYATIPGVNQFSLQITAPGYQTVSVPFTPGSVNVYRCSDLGIVCGPTDCCPLPDGIYDVIYNITIPGQPNEVLEKTFIRVNNIKCSFNKAFCKIDMECGCLNPEQKRYKEQLDSVDLFITGAVAAANDCNNALAFRLYQKAEQILNGLCCSFGLPTTSCNQCAPCATSVSCSTCR